MSKIKDNQTEFIIKEAANLFMERSIEEVTMVDIARSLGIGEATLYRYFGKKQTIVIKAATYIWEMQNEFFRGYIKSNINTTKTGFETLKITFGAFKEIYNFNNQYFKFLYEFDNYVKKEALNDLNDYDFVVRESKAFFDEAVLKGLSDGSIKKINYEEYYYTSTHALLSLCEKMTVNEKIIESDDLVNGYTQVVMLIDILLDYIKGE